MATLEGDRHLYIHFFSSRPRLFHHSTENVRTSSVENEHQSAYSRADTMSIITSKRSEGFP